MSNGTSAALTSLSPLLLQQVSGYIEDHLGLHFPPSRFADLERGLLQAAREADGVAAHSYVESLLCRGLHAADIEALAGNLTIAETHFFRDSHGSELLETSLLPELIAARRNGSRRLRFWSAGCATGEEAYSLAILLHRLIPDLDDWNITILATDINPKVLVRAEIGIYTEWSFRGTPAWIKSKYFNPRPADRYEIQPWLKRMVTFAHLNLAADDYPSPLSNTNAMDLIICRNVLLYFALPRIPQVVRRFHQSLIEGGQLMLGAVEASQVQFAGFTPVISPSVALFRKESTAVCGWPTTGDEACGIPGTDVPSSYLPDALPADLDSPAHHEFFETPPESTASNDAPIARRAAVATPQSLYAGGHYQEACERLLENPASARRTLSSAVLLAECHANLGELAEALVWCERALALAKHDPVNHFLHASILQELQRGEDALQSLRNVLFLDPEHVFAHFTTANLHRRANRQPEASRHFDRVRQLLTNRDERDELPQAGGLTVGQLNSMLGATAIMATPATASADA